MDTIRQQFIDIYKKYEIEKMVADIHRYPLCFAVIDKRWEK